MKTITRILLVFISIAGLVLGIMALRHEPLAQTGFRWAWSAFFFWIAVRWVYKLLLAQALGSGPIARIISIVVSLLICLGAYSLATNPSPAPQYSLMAFLFLIWAFMAGFFLFASSLAEKPKTM